MMAEVIFGECKLFRDVAQAKSLSRAARMNGISQSAATQHIQVLEKRLGTQLLDRSTRPLGLTDAGKLYAELCRDIIRREEHFRVRLDEIGAAAVTGTVRVMSIYSIGLSEMDRLRDEFARACPGAHLHVELGRPDKVYQAVLDDHADLGFISYPEHRRELTVIPWREERMSVAAYPAHPLAARATIEPRDLDGQDFIAFDEEVIIRRELDRFFRESDVSVSTVMQLDNIQSIKEAVALGSRHQHPARANHADRNRAEASGFDRAPCTRPRAPHRRHSQKKERAHARCQSLPRPDRRLTGKAFAHPK